MSPTYERDWSHQADRAERKGRGHHGRGEKPNRHDALTGSQPDGTASAGNYDRTCKNWTSSTQGAAISGTPIVSA